MIASGDMLLERRKKSMAVILYLSVSLAMRLGDIVGCRRRSE